MKLIMNKIKISNFKEGLSENDSLFFDRVYRNGLQPYIDRIKQYNLEGATKVLDAGCGFGQWSLALSFLNQNVFSCDAALNRVDLLKKIVRENAINNIDVQKGFINELPYEDESFDIVFCYGVIFLTPWKISLKELTRVLKKGGTLYVNANGLGWYKNLWYNEPNKSEDYNPKKIAASAWMNTYLYESGEFTSFPTDLIIEPQKMIDELRKLGMSNILSDGEGLLGCADNKNSFFQKEYFGDVGVYEIICEKD